MPRSFALRRLAAVLWLSPWCLAGCAARDEGQVVQAVRGDLPLVAVESGEIAARRSQLVRPPQEWEGDLIIVRMVPEGTVVAQGDTVIWLDPSALERRLVGLSDRLSTLATARLGVLANQHAQRQAQANRVETATLSRLQAELQQQKLRFESPSRRQDAELALERATIALAEARTQLAAQAVLDSLELAKTDLEIAAAQSEERGLRQRIAAMAIRAPLAGMVVYNERRDRDGRMIKARVGDVIDPWQPVASIPDLSAMQVEFMVHEVDRHRFAVGQPVVVKLEAYPESVFTGEIAAIAEMAVETERNSSVRGFVAQAPLAEYDPRLRPGMSAVVEVTVGRLVDTVIIPRAALAEFADQIVVFPRANWPQPQPVRLAALTPLAAAVAAGVAAGTELVVPQAAVPEGVRPLGAAGRIAKEAR